MNIKRDLMTALLKWKQRREHKPLIINGALRIGKTWIMQKFGEKHFSYVAHFNFDVSEELCRKFENTKNPGRLINILSVYIQTARLNLSVY